MDWTILSGLVVVTIGALLATSGYQARFAPRPRGIRRLSIGIGLLSLVAVALVVTLVDGFGAGRMLNAALAFGALMVLVGGGLVVSARYARQHVDPSLRSGVGVTRLALGLVFIVVPFGLALLVKALDHMPNLFPGP